MQTSPPISTSTRHALIFHAAFAVLSIAVLAWGPGSTGMQVLGLVVLYNAVLPLIARWLDHQRWTRIWAFLLPLCVFQILPTGFMDTVLNAMTFPQRDVPMIGPVPLAMVGLWMVPLWLALYAGREASARGIHGAWVAAGVSGLVLTVAELLAGAFPYWQSEGVHTLGPIAVYVVLPGFMLGAAAYIAENRTRGEARLVRIMAAATVAVFYLGALGSSYYFFERIVP